jgi:hypothetical protein
LGYNVALAPELHYTLKAGITEGLNE